MAGEGNPIAGCVGRFCNELPNPVYPTSLYEVIAALLIFWFLWSIRTKIKLPGMMFGIYLMFSAVERFLVELIRVNTKYHVGGISFTQAELISLLLFIAGAALVFNAIRNKEKLAKY